MRYERESVASRGRGFTLVELLVVIAIIALLLAILMPSLARSREMARRAACGSNLHQIHVAHRKWTVDNKGHYVAGQPAYPDESEGHYAVWGRNFADEEKKLKDSLASGGNYDRRYIRYGKYRKHGVLVKNKMTEGDAFYCPSWSHPSIQFETSKDGVGGWFDGGNVPSGQEYMQTSYHYNSQFGSNLYDDDSRWRSAHDALDEPTAALMSDAFSDPEGRGVEQHHGNGYNVLYLDGRVRFIDDSDGRILGGAGDKVKVADLNDGKSFEDDYETQAKAWLIFEGREELID